MLIQVNIDNNSRLSPSLVFVLIVLGREFIDTFSLSLTFYFRSEIDRSLFFPLTQISIRSKTIYYHFLIIIVSIEVTIDNGLSFHFYRSFFFCFFLIENSLFFFFFYLFQIQVIIDNSLSLILLFVCL